MISRAYGALTPDNSFAALAPAVDRYIRETYNDLLSLPLPEQFYDLINSYEEQRETLSSTKGYIEDGAAD
jgi:hypothetical protein